VGQTANEKMMGLFAEVRIIFLRLHAAIMLNAQKGAPWVYRSFLIFNPVDRNKMRKLFSEKITQCLGQCKPPQ
jgi:hypothetical protein